MIIWERALLELLQTECHLDPLCPSSIYLASRESLLIFSLPLFFFLNSSYNSYPTSYSRFSVSFLFSFLG